MHTVSSSAFVPDLFYLVVILLPVFSYTQLAYYLGTFAFVSAFPTPLNTQFFAVPVLKHPRTPSNTLGMMDYQNADHEQLLKRLRSSIDEVLIHCCLQAFFFI